MANRYIKFWRFFMIYTYVRIGALRLLPGISKIFSRLLAESTEDSLRPAVTRGALPPVVSGGFRQPSWGNPDVLVGSFRSIDQFQNNIKRKYYYLPAEYVDDRVLNIQYIALYQSGRLFGNQAGIRYYGKVILAKRLLREEIDFPYDPQKAKAPYYAFRVESWERLGDPISVKEEGVYEPRFTYLPLLNYCTQSFELFHIRSEAEFRLMLAIRKSVLEVNDHERRYNAVICCIHDACYVVVAGGYIAITTHQGRVLDRISVRNYLASPRTGFVRLKRWVEL